MSQQGLVGERNLKLLLSPKEDQARIMDAIAFNVAAEDWPADSASEVEIAYRLAINAFRGAVNLQLIVEHLLASI